MSLLAECLLASQEYQCPIYLIFFLQIPQIWNNIQYSYKPVLLNDAIWLWEFILCQVRCMIMNGAVHLNASLWSFVKPTNIITSIFDHRKYDSLKVHTMTLDSLWDIRVFHFCRFDPSTPLNVIWCTQHILASSFVYSMVTY